MLELQDEIEVAVLFDDLAADDLAVVVAPYRRIFLVRYEVVRVFKAILLDEAGLQVIELRHLLTGYGHVGISLRHPQIFSAWLCCFLAASSSIVAAATSGCTHFHSPSIWIATALPLAAMAP